MNKEVKRIVESNNNKKEKEKQLEMLEQDIEMAKGILSGKWKYCQSCDDYYLEKSFTTANETKEGEICTYEDYINSGGNEYAPGYRDITYRVCPKGHKEIIKVNVSNNVDPKIFEIP